MTHVVIRTARSSVVCSVAVLLAMGCSRSPESRQDTTPPTQSVAQPPDSNAPIMLRGTVVSVSPSQLVLQSDTGKLTVAVTQPFHFYARVPSDLSHVKESSFIGVTTVKQPDGSERATEIHVFPEELRGLGEGSRMMTPAAGTARSGAANRMMNGNVSSRMTNGNVTASRMMNGNASTSRMSNGSVASTNGSTLVVEYAGGSQTVTVPPNTPVTELKLAPKALAAGDKVAVLAKRNADGTLVADKAVSTAK